MVFQICRKCNTIATAVSETRQSAAKRLLDWVVDYRHFHCSHCGSRWSHIAITSDGYAFVERLIYLLLAAGASYLMLELIQ